MRNLPSPLNYSLSPVSSADNNEPPSYGFFVKNRIHELAQIIAGNQQLISDAMQRIDEAKSELQSLADAITDI